MHHTSEVVSALCFDHLVSGPSFCLQKACSRKARHNVAVFKSTPSRAVSLATRGCVSFWRVRRLSIHFESICEKYGSFNMSDCQSCFTSMTLRASGLAVLTAPQIGETIFMPAGSKECPVWLKKFSVQTDMVQCASQTSLVSCARCAPVRSCTHVQVVFHSCLFPPIGFTPTYHTFG